MNLSLTLFLIGFVLIIYGYINQLNHCNNSKQRLCPNAIYDEIKNHLASGGVTTKIIGKLGNLRTPTDDFLIFHIHLRIILITLA